MVAHSWGTISSNDIQHWYECTVCHERKDLANHEGGTATCKEKATCTVCGKQYGSYAPCSYTAEVAASQYLKAAATCNTKAIYYKSCPECGSTGTDTFTEGEVDKINHTGGTATCKEMAVCTDCGQSYGELAQHSYNDYKANNDATCEADGTKTAECVYGCGTTDTVADTGSAKGHDFKTYTSDNNATCQADGTKTAKCENCDKTDTVADEGSKVDHYYGDDNFCDFCGKDKSNPQIGDTTNLVLLTSIMVISLLMAVALVAGMYKAKKVR